MRLPKLDLNLFVVFESIYEKRNLTRVAQALYITQPAVSMRLRACARRSMIPSS